MHTIQATEAKVRLAEILRAVERGEAFAITRHGRTIAHLLPAATADRDARRAAVARFRARRRAWEPAGFTRREILEARHAGHRA
jgi:prevent-host-death family protein